MPSWRRTGSAAPATAERETEGDSGGVSVGPAAAQGNPGPIVTGGPGNNGSRVGMTILHPMAARVSVGHGNPGVGKDGMAVAVVSPEVTAGINGASAGSASAPVGYTGGGVSSFRAGRANETGEGHGSNGEEYLDHGFNGVVTCGLTAVRMNLFKELALMSRIGEGGGRPTGADSPTS